MSTTDLDVLYNGKCPICSAEIAHYRAYCTGAGLNIRFLDLNDVSLDLWDLTTADAEKRLHVRDADGIHTGLDAFITLWRAMPRYAVLARISDAAFVRPTANWIYNSVLAPLLYGLHRRRQRRRASI